MHYLKGGCAALALSVAVLGAGSGPAMAASVLWFDSTPEYGSQAPDALRKEMSDYLSAFKGGSIFTSTYVSGETPGTLAATLLSNSFDVIVFDSTTGGFTFDAADLLAVQNFYASGQNNLLLDGNLYVRSINFNMTSDFPGINGSTGGLTANEVFSLSSRGGGIMIGTDHNCCQTDANQILSALLPGAGFSGNVNPSNDGEFLGTELLNVQAPIAPADLLAHYSSIPSQGIAPTGIFTDFLGNEVELFAQLEIAAFVGGTRNAFISTSFEPSGGTVIIDDPDPPPPPGAIPEPSTWAMMLLGFGALGGTMRSARASRASRTLAPA